jgi:hypothetical protein
MGCWEERSEGHHCAMEMARLWTNVIHSPDETRKRTSFKKDKRRKYHHWQVTVFYKDGERFTRTYTAHAKATRFAERQKKSPVVKMARVIEIS